ncbi:MAG: 4Fe-4S binding protein [Chloroflexi bacterium]|nr:4Fe-4S binding protein [Chloroflexota bacterium]
MASEEQEGPQAVATAPAGRKKRRRGHVHVFDNWCKGCGICIAFCPQHVYEMDEDGRPVVAHEDQCTACHWCDVHCPDLAIVVTEVEEETDGSATDAGQ